MNNPKFNHIYSVDKPTLNDFYKQYQKADSKNLDILETLEVLKNHYAYPLDCLKRHLTLIDN